MDRPPEHPVIRNLARTGRPDGREPRWPVCPICGAEAEAFYQDRRLGGIVGCDVCVRPADPWEHMKEDKSV